MYALRFLSIKVLPQRKKQWMYSYQDLHAWKNELLSLGFSKLLVLVHFVFCKLILYIEAELVK